MQEMSVQGTINVANVEYVNVQYGAEASCAGVIDASYPPSIAVQYGAEKFIVSEFEVPIGRRVFADQPVGDVCDVYVSGSASYGVVIDCVLGSLGDLRLPASAIESFEYEDVVSAGFVPDVYAVRYLAQESGLSRPRAVDSLVALRNLLEMCKSLDVGTVHAFCLKFRLVKDRRGRRFWVIEFT